MAQGWLRFLGTLQTKIMSLPSDLGSYICGFDIPFQNSKGGKLNGHPARKAMAIHRSL
jgi:hypothetical protein